MDDDLYSYWSLWVFPPRPKETPHEIIRRAIANFALPLPLIRSREAPTYGRRGPIGPYAGARRTFLVEDLPDFPIIDRDP